MVQSDIAEYTVFCIAIFIELGLIAIHIDKLSLYRYFTLKRWFTAKDSAEWNQDYRQRENQYI